MNKEPEKGIAVLPSKRGRFVPALRQASTVTSPTAPVVQRVEPKPFDPFLDTIREVKDASDRVIFTGTTRQWAKWARNKEAAARAQYGLPPKAICRKRSSRMQDSAEPCL